MGWRDYHVVVYAWTGFDTIYRRNACRVAYGGCVALDVSFPSELMGRVYSVLQNGYDGREYTAKTGQAWIEVGITIVERVQS